MDAINPQQLLADAKLVHSAEAVQAAITRLGNEITANLVHANPVVICVMNGGLVFAGALITQLKFPLQVDYVHASRYLNDTVGQNLLWYALPTINLTNRVILLLDDILDEGITLLAIQEKCFALGAKNVYTAVLAEKKLTHQKPISANFVGLEVPNRYVFGYGMDVKGWWRNLPEIYALL